MSAKNIAVCVCVFLIVFLITSAGMASAPVCKTTPNNYCSYTGSVKSIYANKFDHLLLYFDTEMTIEQAAAVGYNITRNGELAAVVKISEDPEFARYFYATAMMAQATKREVSIQMRNVLGGYMKIDRIWMKE